MTNLSSQVVCEEHEVNEPYTLSNVATCLALPTSSSNSFNLWHTCFGQLNTDYLRRTINMVTGLPMIGGVQS